MWTWLWPAPALVVLLAGGLATEPYPAGTTAETLMAVALGLLAVPGIVAGVREEVRRSRRPLAERLAEAERMADRQRPVAEWEPPPVTVPTLRHELVLRAVTWGFVQALLAVGLSLLVAALPVDPDWRGLPLVVALVGLAPPLLLVIGWLATAGTGVLWAALRPDADDEPGISLSEVLGRGILLCLGLCLLGLATFGVPFAVVSDGDADLPRHVTALGDYAFDLAEGPSGWLLALRVTCGMVYGGLIGVGVLTPLYLGTLFSRPRRADLPPAAPAAPAGLATPSRPRDAPMAPTSGPPLAALERARPDAVVALTPRERRRLRREALSRAEAHALDDRRATGVLVVTTAAWVAAVGVAAWLAAVTDREHLTWVVATGGRYGAGVVRELMVTRAGLVPLAALVAGAPALLATVGWYRTRRGLARIGRGPATTVSGLSWAAFALSVALVPGLVGCYLVSHWAGPTSDLLLLPGAWVSVGFLGAILVGTFSSGRGHPRRRPRR